MWLRRVHPDDREFMRQILLRHQQATNAMVRALQAVEDSMVSMQAEIADSRAQIRANTKAVLDVLDRLEGGASA